MGAGGANLPPSSDILQALVRKHWLLSLWDACTCHNDVLQQPITKAHKTRHSESRDGRHLARKAAKVGGDRGERAEAEEGVEVEDGHAAAARQLVQLHAEPGDVHHRLYQRGDQRREVIAEPLHITRDALVHVLPDTHSYISHPTGACFVRLETTLAADNGEQKNFPCRFERCKWCRNLLKQTPAAGVF